MITGKLKAINNRRETYKKYVFRRKRNGKTEIFARVGYRDGNGQLKYKYRAARSEEQAAQIAEKMLARFRLSPAPPQFTDEELTEIYFGILDREISFREFKRKLSGL